MILYISYFPLLMAAKVVTFSLFPINDFLRLIVEVEMGSNHNFLETKPSSSFIYYNGMA